MSEKLIYLYCVTDKIPDINAAKKAFGDINSIQVSNFFAVFGKVDTEDFGDGNLQSNINDIDWLTKFANIHERIIESVMKNEANVIPFKFATLFFTEENLKNKLLLQSIIINENFKKLDNKEEWGIKLFCNQALMEKEVSEFNEDIIALDAEITGSKPGKAYILKKKKKDLIKSIAQKEIQFIKADCFESLKNISYKSKINKIQPKELSGKKEDMFLNMVFLIEKKEVKCFLEKVSEIRNSREYNSIILECTGPWPPYNFIEINQD